MPVTISVNFSRIHLTDLNFVQQIEDIVNNYDIPRHYIEIELTESTIFDNEEILQKILIELHNAGFTLSMDDFGAGYSSLGLLKNIPVDVVKIDRSFFTHNFESERAKIVIASIMQMAKLLKISTVAEGIEHLNQIEFLKTVGCDAVQGYFYSKAITVDEFTNKLKELYSNDSQAK